MKVVMKRVAVLAILLVSGVTALRAQSDGALLDALVKKGLLTDQEAEDVRASEIQEYSQTAASKLSLSNHITQLKLYGDVRVRYEYLDESPQSKTFNALDPYANQTTRYRYRLRVGADYTFTDNFTAGFELESNTAADSSNQSLGNGFSKYPINVGLFYLQWKATDWLTLIGGKHRNPLYTTNLVWDPDINPEGASEVLSFHPTDEFSIGLTAGQYIYADNGENSGDSISGFTNGSTTADNTDVWIFGEQVPIQYNFDKDTFIKEVPGFFTYLGGGNANISTSAGAAGSNGVFGGGASIPYTNVHAADNLAILTAPGEFDWKAWDQPFKFYWDFALNLDGKNRIQNVYLFPDGTASTAALRNQNFGLGDNIAWLAGLQVGQNKKKGDWSIKGDYRQVGLGSIDPNLNDSDTADSYLNQQGIRVESAYNFTDFLTGSVTYFNTWNYKSNLFDSLTAAPTAGSNAAAVYALAPANTTQRVEVDLQWKF